MQLSQPQKGQPIEAAMRHINTQAGGVSWLDELQLLQCNLIYSKITTNRLQVAPSDLSRRTARTSGMTLLCYEP